MKFFDVHGIFFSMFSISGIHIELFLSSVESDNNRVVVKLNLFRDCSSKEVEAIEIGLHGQ